MGRKKHVSLTQRKIQELDNLSDDDFEKLVRKNTILYGGASALGVLAIIVGIVVLAILL